MRISDWSSDVCSSDLSGGPRRARPRNRGAYLRRAGRPVVIACGKRAFERDLGVDVFADQLRERAQFGPRQIGDVTALLLRARDGAADDVMQIGRASCREREGQSV